MSKDKKMSLGKSMWRVMRRAPESDRSLLRKVLTLAAAYARAHQEWFRSHPAQPRTDLRPELVLDGVKYFQVGRNATHQFMLGVLEGKAMVLASCYDEDDECMVYALRECEEDWNREYFGHY